MTPDQLNSAILWLMLALSPIGFFTYWRLFRQATTGGAKVKTAAMRAPELLVAFLLITLFIASMASVLQSEPIPDLDVNVLSGSLTYLFIVVMLGSFLHLRGNRLSDLFGFGALSLPVTLRRGFVLIVAAFPAILILSAVMQSALHLQGDEQEVVSVFKTAVGNSDWQRVAAIFVLGTVIAPLAEEFIFRGFLYGVTKRYTGILGGMIFTSAMFAAIHLNLPSLPALFVFAICLNLAYESTGSLAVPMVMHALFNASQLGAMYLIARSSGAL